MPHLRPILLLLFLVCVKLVDGPSATLSADTRHFWPYGLNFADEDGTTNRIRHIIGGQNNEMQHRGVMTLAPDPHDPERVYLATGQYPGPESWKLPSRIYRSTDRGASWTYVTPGLKMSGNGEGRGTGERMSVDPENGANLFLGTSGRGVVVGRIRTRPG